MTFCTFRLGGRDGVAIEVAKWQRAFLKLGWEVRTVAGAGTADRIVAGLGLEPTCEPDVGEVADGLREADLVVVDNVCSLPLNPAATEAVTRSLRARPAILRHHDLVWQHPRWELAGWQVPTDPAWQHVVINELSRSQMAARGLDATTAYNTFDLPHVGHRPETREAISVADDEVLALHPVRAIERKNVPGAIALATALGATYWLTGEAEQGYGPELDRLLSAARTRVIRGPVPDMADAYAACDAVVFPSLWEGFGNPPVEAALHRRPAAVGTYPVASELIERFGFRWFPVDDPVPLAKWLAEPDEELLDHNEETARRHFSTASLSETLQGLLARWDW